MLVDYDKCFIFRNEGRNGRVYDSKLGRFLNSDKFVQDAGSTQNYNSYSYFLNNPLKYSDLTGMKVKSLPQPENVPWSSFIDLLYGSQSSNGLNSPYNDGGGGTSVNNYGNTLLTIIYKLQMNAKIMGTDESILFSAEPETGLFNAVVFIQQNTIGKKELGIPPEEMV